MLLQEAAGRRVLGCHGGLPLADLPLRSLLHVEVPEGAGHASPHLYIMMPLLHYARGETPARVTSVLAEHAHTRGQAWVKRRGRARRPLAAGRTHAELRSPPHPPSQGACADICGRCQGRPLAILEVELTPPLQSS